MRARLRSDHICRAAFTPESPGSFISSTISEGRSFAEAGGVLTYGPSLTAALKLGAVYVDRILKGTKPGDLPIVQPTEFDLVVNLRSAKAIALKVPDSILSRANEVIH